MACYHPIPIFQSGPGAKVILHPRPLGSHSSLIPCGNCIGCKTDQAADWARRAQHEASQWENNCFLTLTYNDDRLPRRGNDPSLEPRDLETFIKRLRRALERSPLTHPLPTIRSVREAGLRYLACGEYGDKTRRPHFHVLLFNCAFADQKQVATDLYESATLGKYWQEGHHKIGALTGASANYVAQYTLKKQVSRRVTDDGLRHKLQQPFLRVSTKPPLGHEWIKKFKSDLQHGYLVTDGRKNRVPRAIKKQLAKIDPLLAEQVAFKAATHKRTEHDKDAAERIHEAKAKLTQQRNL